MTEIYHVQNEDIIGLADEPSYRKRLVGGSGAMVLLLGMMLMGSASGATIKNEAVNTPRQCKTQVIDNKIAYTPDGKMMLDCDGELYTAEHSTLRDGRFRHTGLTPLPTL